MSTDVAAGRRFYRRYDALAALAIGVMELCRRCDELESEKVIAEEMRQWGLGGVAVALVDDQRVVYAAGFGEARRDLDLLVSAACRKLFNALAVMQQVEAGRLDPRRAATRRFSCCRLIRLIDNPPVTLRQTLWPS